MNIKEHIAAGHYPTDDKGRALVPMTAGGTLTVLATDRPGDHPIVGWVTGININYIGAWATDSSYLCPPPPRKVPMRIKIKHENGDFVVWDLSGVPVGLWRNGAELQMDGDAEVVREPA